MLNRIPTLAAALICALSCAATLSHAQEEEYEGFPADRVRKIYPESHVPDPVYPENRVVLRRVDVEQDGPGMRISGEIFTDMESDSVPMGEDLPRGQLMDLMLTVDLYHFEEMIGREDNGTIRLPVIDQKDPGRRVDGQSTRVTITETLSGFGFTTFELPPMEALLAPGIYQLVASLNLPAQTAEIRNATKWVSELYGAEVESVPDRDANGNIVGFRDEFNDVMKNPALHTKWHDELITRIRTLEDAAEIWVGAVKQDNRVEMVPPEEAGDRDPANIMIWTKHHEYANQVVKYETEIEEIDDDWADRELEVFKNLDRGDGAEASEASIERKERSLRNEVRRVQRDNPELITMYGGNATEAEQNMVLAATTARRAVVKQIVEFQEFLVRRYWELLDGHFHYGGWQSVNVPCHRLYEAILTDDPATLEADLIDERDAREETHGGADGYLEMRRKDFENYPSEVQTEALRYVRSRFLSNAWFPGRWVEKPSGAPRHIIREGDRNTYYAWRREFITDFLERTDEVLEDLDTTHWYANAVWPTMLESARTVRDDVICQAYSWEYYIRVEVLSSEDGEPADREVRNSIRDEVVADWEDEAESSAGEDLDLARYHGKSQHDPSSIKSRYDGGIARMKRFLVIKDFAYQFRRAKGAADEDDPLLGFRPRTVPGR